MTVSTAGASARLLPVLLLLSACAGGTADPPEPVAVLAPQPIPSEPDTAVPEMAVSRPAKAEPSLPRPAPEPKPVIGLDRKALSDLMGIPNFKRKDPPAEIWQYRGKDCILDVFLYGDGKGGPYTVTHLEVRGPGDVSPVKKTCLGGLQQAQR